MVYILNKKLYRILLFIFLLVAPVFASDIEISWKENTEADLAGYKLHYGNTSGRYDNQIDIGNKTSTIVTDLTDEIEYYFSLTAKISPNKRVLPVWIAENPYLFRIPSIVLFSFSSRCNSLSSIAI